MKIGIDARELTGKPTGVGRYLGRLLEEWSGSAEAAGCVFVLFLTEGAVPDRLNRLLETGRFALRQVPGAGGTLWEQRQLATAVNRERLDVFFAPAYTAPLRVRAPIVLTVHDVSFAAHPEWFSWREGLRRRWLTRASAQRARLVLTVSEFSRAEIVEHLGVAGGKVRIVRHGIDPRRASPPPGVSAPLILYVGSILNRRHVSDLVRAFARIAGDWPEARLVIAGDNRTQPYEDPAALAADLGIAKHVDVRSYVPEDDLDGLYAGAALFVFLSEYEGFGFPPLEAMSAGVPVVVGDTPAARETCGDAATYVPIGDVAATSAAMRTLLQDDDLRAGQIARGTPVLRRYQWNVAAAETLGALLDAARGDE